MNSPRPLWIALAVFVTFHTSEAQAATVEAHTKACPGIVIGSQLPPSAPNPKKATPGTSGSDEDALYVSVLPKVGSMTCSVFTNKNRLITGKRILDEDCRTKRQQLLDALRKVYPDEYLNVTQKGKPLFVRRASDTIMMWLFSAPGQPLHSAEKACAVEIIHSKYHADGKQIADRFPVGTMGTL